MITGLVEDTARWFLLQVTLLAGSGRMLMGTAHGGVDAQVPHDRALRISQGLEPGENLVPDAVSLPPAKQGADPAPRPVLDGHVPPWHPGSDPEPDAVDQLPPGPDRRPPGHATYTLTDDGRALLTALEHIRTWWQQRKPVT
ncbi:hypothetical protein M878_44875 [Streptomyces roseochromogenus subsp. oscitans DS 12.976]|uniref:Uncharacterized protein n=1 Tax=Streptomyces roseochromogenus subsp. oscitans DS 12.976 TaxID=1352936 RepID=V6JF48_STRRC|nr:hypothetical protein M878_44875 [Streptomyces roseochromogenus subsp. oscitans DS 12.976]